MIDCLIHAYKKGAEPFRSLSALSDAEAVRAMKELYVEGAVIWERFREPADYLRGRRQVEDWLRREFIAKGGRPRADHPIYMVFGRSKWLATMLDPATLASIEEIEVPLAAFAAEDLSFTYPDSMVSCMLDKERNPEYYLPDYHGKVFTLSEMRAIVEKNGLPGYGWGDNLPSGLANYIEAQVWNHELLAAYKEPPAGRHGGATA